MTHDRLRNGQHRLALGSIDWWAGLEMRVKEAEGVTRGANEC